MISIADMIEQVGTGLDLQRKTQEENKGWNVQYIPCGHSREIHWSELELVAKAKEWAETHLDAVILPQSECPECARRANAKHRW